MSATRRWPVVSSLGIVQILAWGSSYYLMAVLAKPFDEQPEHADYALAPQPHERVAVTFCGT